MRRFLIIWTGQAFSLLGSQLVQFALVWWLTRTTGSATVLALATLAALLPQIVLGPFAGAVVDRSSRRAIMIVADAGIALATLVIAALFALGLSSVWIIYILLLLRSAGGAFHWPAMQASTTMLVPQKHLARVGGLNQALVGIAGVFLPPLGALAVEALPMQAVLAIDVVTALIAIVPLLFIAIPQPLRTMAGGDAGAPATMLADMREALRFIRGWRGLWLFSAVGVLINMLGRAAGSLQPILVTQHFMGGAPELGWMQSAAGAGAILGGAILGLWGGSKKRIYTSLAALALDGIAICVAALLPSNAFPVALAAIFMIGFLETVLFGVNGAIAQVIIPPEMQGRVLSLLMSAGQVLAPLGLIVAGPVSDALGVQFWWLLTGITITAMGVLCLFTRDIVRLEDDAAEHRTGLDVRLLGEV